MQASHQWATRPADERFTSLDDLLAHCEQRRRNAVARVVPNEQIEVRPVDEDPLALATIVNGQVGVPTNWAFNQVAGLVGAPAGYLRTLPTPLVADALNYGMQNRPVQEIGTMLVMPDEVTGGIPELTCATGPNYGRVWNADVVSALRTRFGDGITGDFTVPGEFGKPVDVTNANTTLYAGDRDMFVFLADEKHRIEIPNRRNGEPGSLARGFFVWNSEVGSATLGVGTFLFDFVCCNRMIWGAEEYGEIKIRHTSGAPLRFINEVAPALEQYAQASTRSIVEGIEKARTSKFDDSDKLDEFLKARFTRTTAQAIKLAHFNAEARPIESLWDVAVGATEYAKGLPNQDNRVAIERIAGQALALAD
jgi:hypothetical protein